MKKLRIALSSLFYPVFMGRFFWDALERRDDVELYTIGPYFGTYIPWGGGMHINAKYVKTPTIPLPQEVASRPIPYEMVADRLPKDLDAFLMIDAGWHFMTRPHAKKVALIETDPHVLKNLYVKPKVFSDYVFCMQTPYMEDGEIFLPYACDHHIFYPEKREMQHDACLIGLHYAQRDQLVASIRKLGLDVYYDLGIVFDAYREKYNSSKLCLNWSSLDDLPSRVWEGFGMCRPVISNRITDLSKLFVEDTDYLGFSSIPEALAKVTWAIQNPDKADAMAKSAYEKVIAHHTWDIRVEQMLKGMELL